MMAICNAKKPVAFKAPKPSSIAERVPQGTKPGAQPGHKKQSSLKQTFMSSKEATKGGSSKAPAGSKTGHSKKRKEFSSAMNSNPSQPPVSAPVDPRMHKEDQQATGGPTSLRVTSEARSNPQLSSGMSAFNLNEPIYTASFIIHSESALGNDASTVSTAEADPGNSAPSTDPHVHADQTKSVSEGLDTVLTQPLTGKGASSIARQVKKEEASSIIKLEDLAKLMSNVQSSFKDLDSPEDEPVIIIEESDEEKNDEIHATKNVETEDTSVPKSSSPKYSLIQELTNQLKELLVKSLKTKLSNILSTYDFSSSLPTELKDIPSKLNERTREVQRLKNQVHNLEIELPGELKEIPTQLENFTKTVTSLTSEVAELKTLQWELPQEFLSLPTQVATIQAKLKTLDSLPGLLSHVTKTLNTFAQVLVSTSSKAGVKSIPSVGQADTMSAEGEKNTNQATISQLFQRRAEKVHLNKTQPERTTPPLIPPIITTTTQMQSPFCQRTPKESSQTEGEHINTDKRKKAMSLEDPEEESTKSNSDDKTTHVPGSVWMHPRWGVTVMVSELQVRPVELSNRVNNEADHAFTAAVAQTVADLLPTLTARITGKIRQKENNENNDNRRNSRRGNPGGTGNDGDAQPTDIHVWLERFRKEKPQTFVEAENWIAYIEKIFEYFPYSEKERCEREYKSIRQLPEETSTDFMKRFLRLVGFLGAKAGTQEEQAKHFKWGLNDFVLDRILNTEFTDVAQVVNAARNIEIFRDWPKNEEDNKRDKDGHRIRPSGIPLQGSNPRADDQRDSDRYGSRGRHGNKDRYGTDRWRGDRLGSDRHGNGSDRQGNGSQKAWRDQDQ
ncbi:hypothetical protein Tco_0535381 [Tanacetum coccineum]